MILSNGIQSCPNLNHMMNLKLWFLRKKMSSLKNISQDTVQRKRQSEIFIQECVHLSFSQNFVFFGRYAIVWGLKTLQNW